MEVDKSKNISQMTIPELTQLNLRLRKEREVESVILELLRNSGTRWDYDDPPKIDTITPIGQLYPTESDLQSKSISQMNTTELAQLLERLRLEGETHNLIYDLKRNSGERWSWESRPVVDNITPVNQLYHFGIPGMKWGIRKDRSTGQAKGTQATKKVVPKSEDFLESRTFKSKAVAGLSNADLKKLNDRLNLEKQYKDLTKKETLAGKNFLSDSMASGLKQTTTTVVAAASLYAVKKAVEKSFGTQVMSDLFPKKK